MEQKDEWSYQWLEKHLVAINQWLVAATDPRLGPELEEGPQLYVTAKFQSTHIHPCPDLHTFSELYLLFPQGLIILQINHIFIMKLYILYTHTVKGVMTKKMHVFRLVLCKPHF